jgi:hypothetical protein
MVEASKIVIGPTVTVPFLQHKSFNATEVSFFSFCVESFADLHFKIDGGNWPALSPGRFTPEEITPGTHCLAGWEGRRASVDILDKNKYLAAAGNRTTIR